MSLFFFSEPTKDLNKVKPSTVAKDIKGQDSKEGGQTGFGRGGSSVDAAERYGIPM